MTTSDKRLRDLIGRIADDELRDQILRELERSARVGLEPGKKALGLLTAKDANIRADRPTPNNRRVYSTSVLLRAFEEYSERMSNHRAIGRLFDPETPNDPMRLQDVSHIVRDLRLDDEGNINGSIEILPTEQGRLVHAMNQAGIRFDLVTSGRGTVGPDGVVGDDYQIMSVDLVPRMTQSRWSLTSPDEDEDE